MGGLVALLVAFPFLESVAKPLVLVIPLTGVFVTAVVVADAEPRHVRRAILLAIIQVALTVASLVQREERFTYQAGVALALAAEVVLILFSTLCVLRYVLRARFISRDQIDAGICMYLMFGFAFGVLFYMVNILEPGSFAAANEPPGHTPDLMYFSFVTLTTLGYGDITPRTSGVRTLAVLEALIGMLYIAIFMARLVSMGTSKDETESD
ncbi:MAG: potassium channel family protein [Candidatus Solibacter sp.]